MCGVDFLRVRRVACVHTLTNAILRTRPECVCVSATRQAEFAHMVCVLTQTTTWRMCKVIYQYTHTENTLPTTHQNSKTVNKFLVIFF